MICGCRCMNCKSSLLESKNFMTDDGFDDIHHHARNVEYILIIWMANNLKPVLFAITLKLNKNNCIYKILRILAIQIL